MHRVTKSHTQLKRLSMHACSWGIYTCMCLLTHLCLTPWDPTNYSPLGSSVHEIFSRQEYWSSLPFPIPGDPPDPGIKPTSLASPALAGGFFTTAPSGKPQSWTELEFKPRCVIFSDRILRTVLDCTLQYFPCNHIRLTWSS